MSGGCLVVGAGGHAKVVLGLLEAAGLPVAGVLDDSEAKWGRSLLGVPVLGPIALLDERPGAEAVIAIGANRARKELAEAHPRTRWIRAVHPHAWVHRSVELGPGTLVFAGAVVQPDTRLGAHVILNTSASVDHDGAIGDYVHMAPGVHLAGNVSLGEGVFLGVGVGVIPGRSIGAWTRVGAGGVVVRDLPAGITAMGVPARPKA